MKGALQVVATLWVKRPAERGPASCIHSLGREEIQMLWTIAVLLFLLWLVGMVSNYTLGGFIHLLFLLAIASILIRIIQGQRPI